MNSPPLIYRETFARLRDHLPGAGVPWITRMRGKAMSEFQQQAFPDTRVEAWKYTDLRSLKRRSFSPPITRGEIHESALQPWLFNHQPMHRLVFVDGRFAPDLCPFQTWLDGVTLTSLATVMEHNPDELETVLGHTLGTDRPGFDAMNTAFLQDGAFIRLDRDAVLEQPIHLLFISTAQTDSLTTVRNVIQSGPDSAATVIESWVALNDATSLTNTITEIVLDENAALQHYKLEQEGAAATHIGGLYVQQDHSSHLDAYSIALGGRMVRNELQVDLNGRGAECTLNGLTLTHDQQHVDNHTRIEHHQPQATSNEWYKGILDDRSRTVFSGRIVVHPGAQQTQAQQSNHSLLLSNDAEADARPQFEIYADDVQCRHGCTVGELDAEALFYLRSRALDEDSARSLLVYAFAADVLDRMRLDSVRHYLEQQLAERLTGSAAILQDMPRH
ncbi:MAG: Fe-S cluster assembly protein SufD [Pseudomonadota bacterium]|nr:Fe-S cluster assembly protein SufD [Pseudomonadota bacterium]